MCKKMDESHPLSTRRGNQSATLHFLSSFFIGRFSLSSPSLPSIDLLLAITLFDCRKFEKLFSMTVSKLSSIFFLSDLKSLRLLE